MFVCAVPFDELFPSITEVGNPYTNHGGAALFASPPLCGSALHALTRCLALAVFLPLLLGFPLTQFNITRRQLVYGPIPRRDYRAEVRKPADSADDRTPRSWVRPRKSGLVQVRPLAQLFRTGYPPGRENR